MNRAVVWLSAASVAVRPDRTAPGTVRSATGAE